MTILIRILILTLLSFYSINAYSEPEWRNKPVQCGKPDSLLSLLERAGEVAIVGGLSDLRLAGSSTSDLNPVYFFANTNEKTFTIIEYHLASEEVCVIAYGVSLDFDVQKLFDSKKSL